jgi:hypothetical protein
VPLGLGPDERLLVLQVRLNPPRLGRRLRVVGLVHDDDVRPVQQRFLVQLHVGPVLRRHAEDRMIDERRHAQIDLAQAPPIPQ